MSVQVRLFATFQEIAGTNRVDLDATSVREVLGQMTRVFEGLHREVFEDAEGTRLRERVKIMVNGINIEFLDGLATELAEGDRVAVFPTVAGG